MITLTAIALLVSGGSIPIFAGCLITYDLIILAAIFRKKIFQAFKLKSLDR